MPKARPTTTRYPLQPLLERAQTPDLHTLADRLGLAHQTVRLANTRGLSDWQADHWATRLGLHASWVWRDLWWANAPGELDPTG